MNKEGLFYSETVRRTQEQYDSRQHFDTMATAVLSVGGIVLSTMVVTVSHWSNWSIIPASLAIIAFFILSFSMVRSLWISEWDFHPPLQLLSTNVKSSKYTDNELIQGASDLMIEAITTNEKTLSRKAKWLNFGYITLAVEVLLIGWLIVSASI